MALNESLSELHADLCLFQRLKLAVYRPLGFFFFLLLKIRIYMVEDCEKKTELLSDSLRMSNQDRPTIHWSFYWKQKLSTISFLLHNQGGPFHARGRAEGSTARTAGSRRGGSRRRRPDDRSAARAREGRLGGRRGRRGRRDGRNGHVQRVHESREDCRASGGRHEKVKKKMQAKIPAED